MSVTSNTVPPANDVSPTAANNTSDTLTTTSGTVSIDAARLPSPALSKKDHIEALIFEYKHSRAALQAQLEELERGLVPGRAADQDLVGAIWLALHPSTATAGPTQARKPNAPMTDITGSRFLAAIGRRKLKRSRSDADAATVTAAVEAGERPMKIRRAASAPLSGPGPTQILAHVDKPPFKVRDFAYPAPVAPAPTPAPVRRSDRVRALPPTATPAAPASTPKPKPKRTSTAPRKAERPRTTASRFKAQAAARASSESSSPKAKARAARSRAPPAEGTRRSARLSPTKAQ